MRLRSCLSFAVLGFASACTSSPGYSTQPAAACPAGGRVDFASCVSDGLTSDCGGSGNSDWLACNEVECRLFEGGCVAIGYDEIACDLADPCCPGNALINLANPIEFWSTAFYQSFGRSVAVLESAYVLDLEVATPSQYEGPSIVCPTSDASSPVCGDAPSIEAVPATRFVSTSRSRAIASYNGVGGAGFVIDVLPSSSLSHAARVCRFSSADYSSSSCLRDALPEFEVRCATSGIVTWDGAGAGRAEVVIDGGEWRIDF